MKSVECFCTASSLILSTAVVPAGQKCSYSSVRVPNRDPCDGTRFLRSPRCHIHRFDPNEPWGPAQVIHVTLCVNESASEPSGMFVAPVSMHTSPRAPTQLPNPKPFLSIKDEGKEGRVSIQSVSRLRMPHSQVATPRARPRGREVVLCAL